MCFVFLFLGREAKRLVHQLVQVHAPLGVYLDDFVHKSPLNPLLIY